MELYLTFFALFAGIWSRGLCTLKFSESVVDLISGTCANVTLYNEDASLRNGTIKLNAEFPEIASVDPQLIKVTPGKSSWLIETCGHEGGFTVVSAAAKLQNTKKVGYLHVIVSKVKFLKLVSDIFGWIYFTSWSMSFYPQICTNYRRKSVVGLNFDFVAFNIVGFLLYSAYNCGMYYVPTIQNEYFDLHPKGLNPVMFNDVFFSVHAAIVTIVTIGQCLIYDRGDQKVSVATKAILMMYATLMLVFSISVVLHIITWLEFLYYCSYIKLSITIIKYMPQAYMNYSRKSTVGWSIGNVMLDFTGGAFSILQMVINGYNFDDWESLFGDPTKFGLGLFSIAFDILFIYQHYVLYRVTDDYEELENEVQPPGETTNSTDVAPEISETGEG